MVFTDGSKIEVVKWEVARGWFEEGGTNTGGVPVGPKATVCDGKLAGIKEALKMVGRALVLILADCRAALQAIKVAGARRKARIRGLMEVICLISEIKDKCGEKSVSLAWVMAHISISGNEGTDVEVKGAVIVGGGKAVTERGIRAWVKEIREGERVVRGFRVGRVVQ